MRFKNYLLIEQIGKGAQGTVSLYNDKRLGREVAIKSLNSAVMIGDSLLTDQVFAKNANIPFIHISKEATESSISHLGVLFDYLKC